MSRGLRIRDRIRSRVRHTGHLTRHAFAKKYRVVGSYVRSGRRLFNVDDLNGRAYRTLWFAEQARRDYDMNHNRPVLYDGRGKDVYYFIETVPHACSGDWCHWLEVNST